MHLTIDKHRYIQSSDVLSVFMLKNTKQRGNIKVVNVLHVCKV